MLFNKKEENETGSNYRQMGDNTLVIVVGFIVVAAIIGVSIYNNSINKECSNFEKETIDAGFKFAMNSSLLPSYEGTSFKLNLDAIPGWNNKFRGSSCDGTLNIVKTDTGYVKELDLTGCNKCTTSKKSLGKETETFKDNKNIVRVNVTYNYKTRQINYSTWTDWYESSLISPTATKNNVNLPYDEKNYPIVPNGSEVISYEAEKKTFYSYRDMSWKYYKNSNNDYSEFSSEKPADYAYKDAKTEIETEYTEWSTNYPEEKEYRSIATSTGYRFYYIDEDDDKIYYNNGDYVVSIDDDTLAKKYNKKDKETVKMYRYKDSKWRWYNGKARDYSSYTNQASASYPYKDDGLVKYTTWSSYKESSSVNTSNTEYREEKTDIHSRFRAKYSIDSLELLNEYLPIQDFETATGKAVKDMQADEKIKVSIKYTYRYEK